MNVRIFRLITILQHSITDFSK